MYVFAEELIEVYGAREKFYKLSVNGKFLIDDFWDKIRKEGNYEDDLDKIQAIIEKMSNPEPIPPKLFKEHKGRKKNDHTKDYEIKRRTDAQPGLLDGSDSVGFIFLC
jgi:hypothetical protein